MIDKELLKQVSFFSRLSDDELEIIAKITKENTYKENFVIFREKEKGGVLFIIKEGNVKIYKELISGKKTLASLKKGDVFGELSLFDNLPRSATAIASTESAILSIKNEDLSKMMELNTEFAYKLMRNAIQEVSLRLRETNEKMQENILWTLTAKL